MWFEGLAFTGFRGLRLWSFKAWLLEFEDFRLLDLRV